MELLIFKLKSGIKIKPSHKGLFTKYCHGKVTSACISKGKHSSNPAIRKRATFAANARKWKHEEGGKVKKHLAFVNGVSILDSNPDAYKYVKKKLHKAAGGTKTSWWQKASNWYSLNLGTLSSLADIGTNIASSILKLKNAAKLIEANNIATKASEQDLLNKYYLEEYNNVLDQLLKANTNGEIINHSDIVSLNLAYLRALRKAKAEIQALKNQTKMNNALIQQDANENLTNAIVGSVGGFMKTGLGLLAKKTPTL